MAAVTTGAPRATDPGLHGPVPARAVRPPAGDWSPDDGLAGAARAAPAAPAATEVWSRWVGIVHKTEFGLVAHCPGSTLAAPGDRHHPPGRCRDPRRVHAARPPEKEGGRRYEVPDHQYAQEPAYCTRARAHQLRCPSG